MKGLNETWGLNVYLLRFFPLLPQVLDFLDVKGGDEWVDSLAVLIDKPGVLKLTTKMQLLLNL